MAIVSAVLVLLAAFAQTIGTFTWAHNGHKFEVTLAFVVVVLALVGLLATLRPARKVCRLDPIFLFRNE
jgi:hypothetical protein